MQTPAHEQPAFEAICAPIDDFELLPAVTPPPEQLPEDDPEVAREQRSARLDELILAGLVSV